jgi:hypothetical protein
VDPFIRGNQQLWEEWADINYHSQGYDGRDSRPRQIHCARWNARAWAMWRASRCCTCNAISAKIRCAGPCWARRWRASIFPKKRSPMHASWLLRCRFPHASEQPPDAAFTPAQEAQFRAHQAAWDFFQSQAAWYRRTATWWVISAKQEATREKRLATLIADSAEGRTLRHLSRKPKTTDTLG